MAKFELVINNSEPLSFVEMREIIRIIDDHIAQDLGLSSRRRGYEWECYEGDFSFVEIESARSGSIILTLAITGVAVWGLGAFALGLRRSRLGSEISRFGENAGNIFSDGLDVVNGRLEEWSEINTRMRERETRVTLKRIPPDHE